MRQQAVIFSILDSHHVPRHRFFQELNEVANRLDKEYQDVEKDR